MKISLVPTELIDGLRAWFHPKDRSVVVATDCFVDMDEQAKPSTNPSPGRDRLYPKAGNNWYVLDSLGTETLLGGGSGLPVHDHSSNAEGGQLDWDVVWSDAVHNHTTNAEGGLLPQIVRERKAPLADDTAYNFGAPTLGNRFIFGLVANAGEYFWGVCTYNGIVAFNSSGFAVVAGGGTLAGTTGPDGSINVRDNNGSLYVENRRGSARNIGVAFIASD